MNYKEKCRNIEKKAINYNKQYGYNVPIKEKIFPRDIIKTK